MSKPVHGDEQYDIAAKKLADYIEKSVTQNFCANLDLKLAKRLAKLFKMAAAECDDAVITKIRQGMSGLSSSLKKSKPEPETPELPDLPELFD